VLNDHTAPTAETAESLSAERERLVGDVDAKDFVKRHDDSDEVNAAMADVSRQVNMINLAKDSNADSVLGVLDDDDNRDYVIDEDEAVDAPEEDENDPLSSVPIDTLRFFFAAHVLEPVIQRNAIQARVKVCTPLLFCYDLMPSHLYL
jgi:hypothetical protein